MLKQRGQQGSAGSLTGLSSDGVTLCGFNHRTVCVIRPWGDNVETLKQVFLSCILNYAQLIIWVTAFKGFRDFRISGHINVWYAAAGAMHCGGCTVLEKHAVWRSSDLIVRWTARWLLQQIPTRFPTGRPIYRNSRVCCQHIFMFTENEGKKKEGDQVKYSQEKPMESQHVYWQNSHLLS